MKTGKTLVITGAYEVDIKEYPVPADNTWFCRRMIHSLQADDAQFSLVRNPNSSYTIK